MSHKKIDRFSRFDVYWIPTNKQTDKQANRQAKFIYRFRVLKVVMFFLLQKKNAVSIFLFCLYFILSKKIVSKRRKHLKLILPTYSFINALFSFNRFFYDCVVFVLLGTVFKKYMSLKNKDIFADLFPFLEMGTLLVLKLMSPVLNRSCLKKPNFPVFLYTTGCPTSY